MPLTTAPATTPKAPCGQNTTATIAALNTAATGAVLNTAATGAMGRY